MKINIGVNGARPIGFESKYANRHFLVTGATGSGKSVTVKRIVETLCLDGADAFVFDAKGDLSGLAIGPLATRATFIDVFGETGRREVLSFAAMGPDATARALGLSFAQAGVVDLAFAFAKSHGKRLASPGDLIALMADLTRGDGAVGHVTSASVGVIRRSLIRLDAFAFADGDGRTPTLAFRPGVRILDARRLMNSPTLYGAAVVQVLGDLYARLPEVGDLCSPRVVIVIDEAHLVFAGLESELLAKIERIVRLIRSKGVCLVFASQAPSDLPPIIAAQLANRVQHAMRAATAQDQRAVQAAADTMPGATAQTVKEIGELRPGEALVSLVQADGRPSPVERVRITPPNCALGPASDDMRLASAVRSESTVETATPISAFLDAGGARLIRPAILSLVVAVASVSLLADYGPGKGLASVGVVLAILYGPAGLVRLASFVVWALLHGAYRRR